jgi:hypothetical protein
MSKERLIIVHNDFYLKRMAAYNGRVPDEANILAKLDHPNLLMLLLL